MPWPSMGVFSSFSSSLFLILRFLRYFFKKNPKQLNINLIGNKHNLKTNLNNLIILFLFLAFNFKKNIKICFYSTQLNIKKLN